jgi:hypothetical protein
MCIQNLFKIVRYVRLSGKILKPYVNVYLKPVLKSCKLSVIFTVFLRNYWHNFYVSVFLFLCVVMLLCYLFMAVCVGRLYKNYKVLKDV